MQRSLPLIFAILAACSGTKPVEQPDAGDAGVDAGARDSGTAPDAGDAGNEQDAGTHADAGLVDAGTPDTLVNNRNRVLRTYLAFLVANPTSTQTNGLTGSTLTSVCDLWSKLDGSSRAVFLTLTHRLQGSTLGADGSSMLSHVVKAYRVVGGQGAQVIPPGGCGNREYNRMILSIDEPLHAALVAANASPGASLMDVPTHADNVWRDSHDSGGPHGPFDLSDETDAGSPRAQVQFYRDPSSQLASSPFGRTDLTTLVDPYMMEIDQDYDCIHDSNPSCQYVIYGDLCTPQPTILGSDLYKAGYGDFTPDWAPDPCN